MASANQIVDPEPTKVSHDSPVESDPESSSPRDAGKEAMEGSMGAVPEDEITGVKLLVLHIGLCLCTFLVGLDFNLIATAVPAITSDFSSIGDVGWYGGAFYIALQPLAGKTFTLFPKKITYLTYVAIFEIGSLVCALAPNSNALIVGRAVAGLGASGIFAGGMIILITIIPLHRRAVWSGTLNSTFAIASIVGPVIGGALTQHVTWRWCFWINLPIGGFSASVVLIFFKVKRAETENVSLVTKLKGLDGVGFLLFGGSVTMLLLALQWGGVAYAWNSSVIIGLFVGFAVTMPIFVAWSFHLMDHALISPNLFRHKNMILIFCSALLANGPFQVVVYWLPVWFQAVLGASPTSSGVRYLPTVISDVLTSFIGSGIVTKLGAWNPFLMAGAALVSLGCGLLSTISPGVPDGHWIGFQILGGIGYSLLITMAHLGVQATLPPDLAPIGATTLLFGMSVSCAVFLAAGQAVFQERLVRDLAQVVSSETVDAIITAGATRIREVVDQADLRTILDAYSDAVTDVFYIPAAGPVVSFFLICGTSWISLKKSETKAKEEEEK